MQKLHYVTFFSWNVEFGGLGIGATSSDHGSLIQIWKKKHFNTKGVILTSV